MPYISICCDLNRRMDMHKKQSEAQYLGILVSHTLAFLCFFFALDPFAFFEEL
jgi:predicted GIY-YIG superfamily endonuclease